VTNAKRSMWPRWMAVVMHQLAVSLGMAAMVDMIVEITERMDERPGTADSDDFTEVRREG
jgi:hypothetical protein